MKHIPFFVGVVIGFFISYISFGLAVAFKVLP